MMTFTAKQFQIILDIVHKWYLEGFRDLLVNGQLALPYDFERNVLQYCVMYNLKPEPQLPLPLAYALTTHTCQGITIPVSIKLDSDTTWPVDASIDQI